MNYSYDISFADGILAYKKIPSLSEARTRELKLFSNLDKEIKIERIKKERKKKRDEDKNQRKCSLHHNRRGWWYWHDFY